MKKWAWILGIVFLGVALLAGCQTSTGAQAGETTVQGTLLDPCGQPVAYKTVLVPGHDPVLTGSDGSFAIEGVAPPYDLVVVGASLDGFRVYTPMVYYQGLNDTEPTLTIMPAGFDEGGCANVSVSGAVGPTEQSDEYLNGVAVAVGPYLYGSEFVYDEDYELSLGFDPALEGENNATIVALQWQRDLTTGSAVAYTGAVRETLTLADGDNLTHDLTVTEIGTGSLNVSASYPDVYTNARARQVPALDGTSLPFGASFAAVDSGGSVALAAPADNSLGLGSYAVLQAMYGGLAGGEYASVSPDDLDGIDGEVVAWQRAAGNEVALELPDPVVPITPLNGATINPAEQSFSWVGPEGATYVVQLNFEGTIGVEIVTKETSIELPDLTSLGVDFGSYDYGYWMLFAYSQDGVDPGADALVGGIGDLPDAVRKMMMPNGSDYGSESGYRFMVYAGQFSAAGYNPFTIH